MPFDSVGICMSLLTAESEAEVEKVVGSTSLMMNNSNWRPLDRRETNFNVTSNQASDGGKALTELITNMVDAVLMKHAFQKGIDPRSKNAPQTMYEAVQKLIKRIPNGRLVDLGPDDPWLRDFASKNLVIGITGAKNKKEGLPCYTFADNGEGQHPADFERTFLSLSEGNKKSIPFVQGKYNMGSSGVLGYCGRRWFKLIVSRRWDEKSPWGWTLMRRRPGGGMPVAEYFVLGSGEIPSFDSDALYPFTKSDGNRYAGVFLKTGTVIKLYDYQVGSKFLTFRGSREALNENLVETILPFRLLDFRQKPDPKRGGERAEGIDPRPFYGMEFLLLQSHREKDVEDEEEAAGERRIAVGTVDHPELGKILISAIALKRQLPGWLKNTNIRVFHTLNGQVQFKQTRGYLSDCGFPALKDRVVIIVDASNLSFEAHNDVWKGDREHIRETIVGEQYKDQVRQTIKESKVLEDLQLQVAREELDRVSKSEENDLFQRLVDADRNLAMLLSNRDPQIQLHTKGGDSGGDSGKGLFEGKYSPTFLRIEEKVHEKGIDIPINKTRPIAARTDAGNGYLDRAENCGHLLIEQKVLESFGIRAHLHDGKLTLFFTPIKGTTKVGDSFSFRIGLKDPAMAIEVEDSLTVRIVPEITESEKPKDKTHRTEKAGSGKDDKGNGQKAPTHGLPRYQLMTKDGREIGEKQTEKWPENFDEYDGGAAIDLGNGEIIYKINYDNAYHIQTRKQQRGDVARDVVTEKYILSMRIMMLGYERALSVLSERGPEAIREFLDEFRRMAARGSASTVLTLAEHLPKIIDASARGQEVE